MTHLIIGTDDAAIGTLRAQLREADPAAEIQLKSARDFDPQSLSDAPKVYVVGDFPEIVAAYGDRVQGQAITGTDAVADETTTTSKKKVSK